MPKPEHLTWEEAACNALCNSTSYRMIVSPNGSQMTQGQSVLVWGATGGIGAYAVQYVNNGGGTPVGVVSSEKRADLLRELGCDAVIDRRAENYKFWNDDDTEQDPAEWLRFGKKIRELIGRDVDIVFEHPGRSTMGASVFVAKRGGMIITCAATSGFKIEYDNRYLWMNLKTLKGCHFANYREAWEANRLVCEARIHPTLSKVYSLDDTGEAAYQVHRNLAEGKVGVLVPRARGGPRRHRRGDACRSTSTRSRCSAATPTDRGLAPGQEHRVEVTPPRRSRGTAAAVCGSGQAVQEQRHRRERRRDEEREQPARVAAEQRRTRAARARARRSSTTSASRPSGSRRPRGGKFRAVRSDR